LEIALELQASGRLAPRDAWMVGDLEARLAVAAGDTAGERDTAGGPQHSSLRKVTAWVGDKLRRLSGR
jgi:hypothetical protein